MRHDPASAVCSEIPIRRMTSATGVPVSACFNAKAICSSVYLDFLISGSLPEGFSRPETFAQNGLKNRGDVNHPIPQFARPTSPPKDNFESSDQTRINLCSRDPSLASAMQWPWPQ